MLRNDKTRSKLSALIQIVIISKLLIWLTACESSHYLARGHNKRKTFHSQCQAKWSCGCGQLSHWHFTVQNKNVFVLVCGVMAIKRNWQSLSQSKISPFHNTESFCRRRRLALLRIETSWASYVQIISRLLLITTLLGKSVKSARLRGVLTQNTNI